MCLAHVREPFPQRVPGNCTAPPRERPTVLPNGFAIRSGSVARTGGVRALPTMSVYAPPIFLNSCDVAPAQQPAIKSTLDYRITPPCDIYLPERGLQSGQCCRHIVHDVSGHMSLRISNRLTARGTPQSQMKWGRAGGVRCGTLRQGSLFVWSFAQ